MTVCQTLEQQIAKATERLNSTSDFFVANNSEEKLDFKAVSKFLNLNVFFKDK